MLSVRGLETCYGTSQVLYGVDLEVADAEVVTLLGRNGMGKTTTVRSIMGLTPPRGGSVRFRGRELAGAASHVVARAGIGLVPEGRQIFPNLSVHENLRVAARRPPTGERAPWSEERVYALFPALAERRRSMGAQLSGGEQQMLAIGRALTTAPRLLILDEATEGLAPLVRDVIWRAIRELKAEGQSILLIDKNLDALLGVADRHFVMEKGRVVWHGASEALAAGEEVKNRYLGV